MTMTDRTAAGRALTGAAPTETHRVIDAAVRELGDGPLTEAGVIAHLHPLFSRVLEREELYFANHSLGRPLDRMADDMAEFSDLWYRDMDGAWGPWMEEQSRYRESVAALIGCARPDAVVPKTSAAQGLRAVLNALPTGGDASIHRPVRVIAPEAEFDSIDFVLKAYARKGRIDLTRVAPDDEGVTHGSDVVSAIEAAGEAPDLVVVSQVFFASGQQLTGLDQIVAAARGRGSLVLLDTYHGAGVLPGVFDESGIDFAIGGNYKYTRCGPGACWLAIAERHLDREDLFSLDTGWFAKRDTFGYARSDRAEFAEGGDGWLEATPPIATMYQSRSGLALTLALGIERQRAYQLEQQHAMTDMLRDRGVALHLIEPRGAFFLMPTQNLSGTLAALKASGVNADGRPLRAGGRELAFVRFCPDLLSTRDEMREASDRIARVMKTMTVQGGRPGA